MVATVSTCSLEKTMSHSRIKQFGVSAVVLSLFLSLTSDALAQPGSDGPDRRKERRRRTRQGKMRDDSAPKAGDIAPPFKLKSFDGKEEVELRGLRGKRPVVLFFGSYT
jgi:hypothetical protein